ncbi:MAG: hypothetical protein RMA76_20905 [Deltaproteobacteria bacterium]|jgi:hypothetical protein
MSTRRLPPSHAPAHGRRRQEGGTTVPGGPGAADGTAPGRRVGQQGRTAEVTKGLAETDSSAEDRAKKRRRTEEEHRLFVAERREVHTRSRRRVLRSVETHLDDRRTDTRETGDRKTFESRAPDRPMSRSDAVQRAAGAFERCAGYMSRGLASEASFTFRSEAMQARSAASAMGPRTTEGRTLEAMAANMELRADALRAMPPGHARKLAHSMDRLASGTQARAERTPGFDGRLLASVAMDTAALAALLEIGADNCEAFLSKGLLRALMRLADKGVDLMKGRHVPQLDGASDPKAEGRDLQKLVGRVGRGIEDARIPLHRLGAPTVDGPVPGADLRALAEHPLLKDLWPALVALSGALAQGDPRNVQRARGALLDGLRQHPQLGVAKNHLGLSLPANPKGVSDRVASEQMLPTLLLNGMLRGQVANILAPDNTNPMWQWMKNAAAPPPQGVDLTASEQMISDLWNHGTTAWPAQALGRSEHMLQASYGWLRTAGQVSQSIQSLTTSGVQAHVTASDKNALTSLPPIGAHEKAVLVDKNGVVLVRSEDGPRFHQGHLVDASGERHYFDTHPLQAGLQRVEYTSASNATNRTNRVELEVAGDRAQLLEREAAQRSVFVGPGVVGGELEGVEAAEDDDAAPTVKHRTWSTQDGEYEDIAAVAIFNATPTATGFRGVTTRHAARLAADAIDRINAGLPRDLRQPHLYLESASDAAVRLAELGHDHSDVFQEHVRVSLLGIDCNPSASALLVLFATDAEGEARAEGILDELDGRADVVAGGTCAPYVMGDDHLRDERLMVDGVLLVQRPGAAIIS